VKVVNAVRAALGATVGRVLRFLLTGLITGYRRLLSPLLGPRCRFYPSCSAYALEAISVHGAAKGTALATARICRCHPWTPGGVDNVPPKGAWRPEPYVSLEDFSDVRAALDAEIAGRSSTATSPPMPDRPDHRSAA
jgi:putative membrane protein insertion efficiency factor